MKNSMGIIPAALAVCIFVASAAFGGSDMGAKLKSACSSCHDLKPVCKLLGKTDEAGWQEIVSRMITHGANLSRADVAPAGKYLTDLVPGDNDLCK